MKIKDLEPDNKGNVLIKLEVLHSLRMQYCKRSWSYGCDFKRKRVLELITFYDDLFSKICREELDFEFYNHELGE